MTRLSGSIAATWLRTGRQSSPLVGDDQTRRVAVAPVRDWDVNSCPGGSEFGDLKRLIEVAILAEVGREGRVPGRCLAARGPPRSGSQGRQPPCDYLTEQQIAEVVGLYESGLSIYKIQDELGVPKTTVRIALT